MAYVAVILMGLVLGTLGGGGGILTVPILVGLFGMAPEAATGGSLLVVGLTSAVGAGIGLFRKESDPRTGLLLAIPSSLGAFAARAWLVPALPATMAGIERGRWLLGTFAVLMVVVGIRMLRPTPEAGEATKKSVALVALVGMAIGLLSGTLGAGGGFLILPVLTVILGMDLKQAIPTSLIVITLQSLVGFSGELHKPVAWNPLLGVAGVAILGLLAGLPLRERAPRSTLQKSFAGLVFLVAAWLFLRVFEII